MGKTNTFTNNLKIEKIEELLDCTEEERAVIADRLFNKNWRETKFAIISNVVTSLLFTISVLCLVFISFGSILGVESVSFYDILNNFNNYDSVFKHFANDNWFNKVSIILFIVGCCIIGLLVLIAIICLIIGLCKFKKYDEGQKIRDVLANPEQYSICLNNEVDENQIKDKKHEKVFSFITAMIISVLIISAFICLPVTWTLYMEGLFEVNYAMLVGFGLVLVCGWIELTFTPIIYFANPKDEYYESDKKLLEQILSVEKFK